MTPTQPAFSPAGMKKATLTAPRPGSTRDSPCATRRPAAARTSSSGNSKEEGENGLDNERQRPNDMTLQDPRCVFQILKRHYERYTPEMVERICGTPKEAFIKVAETLCENSGREKTTAFCYAVGWTQHSKGVQIIRSAAILQLLLGNIGRPGGGIMALRGHADHPGFHRYRHPLQRAPRLPSNAECE